MILFYGTGGVPGGGEIPMDPIRYRASDDFLLLGADRPAEGRTAGLWRRGDRRRGGAVLIRRVRL